MKKWKITSIKDLCDCLHYSIEDVEAACNQVEKYYKNKIEIPKKGGKRVICEIDKTCRLYTIQKNFKKNFLDSILLSDRAFGFVKDTNYFDYLKEHIDLNSNSAYLRLDVSNFFGSIHEEHIENALDFYISGEERDAILNIIKRITLYNNELIQGTPIAPTLSNIVFRPLDIRIERYCQKQNIKYSRYADDLLFSREDGEFSYKFIHTIERILHSKNLSINKSKTRKMKKEMSLNGFVVDSSVRLSRKKTKPISGMIYYLEHHRFHSNKEWFKAFNDEMSKLGNAHLGNKEEIINVLAGNRAFLISSIHESTDDKYLIRAQKLIGRIEKQIIALSS